VHREPPAKEQYDASDYDCHGVAKGLDRSAEKIAILGERRYSPVSRAKARQSRRLAASAAAPAGVSW
jgi:hypothetical protein